MTFQDGIAHPCPDRTARISGDCNPTWPGNGTRGCAGFGIFKRLWQTRGLVNRCNSGQFYPVLSEDFCAQKSVIKIHAYLCRWSGNFLVSFCILLH